MDKKQGIQLGKVLILIVLGISLGALYTLNAQKEPGDIWVLSLKEDFPLTMNGSEFLWINLPSTLPDKQEFSEKDLTAIHAAETSSVVQSVIDGREYENRITYFTSSVVENTDGSNTEETVEYALVFFVFDNQPSVITCVNMKTFQVTQPEIEIIDK